LSGQFDKPPQPFYEDCKKVTGKRIPLTDTYGFFEGGRGETLTIIEKKVEDMRVEIEEIQVGSKPKYPSMSLKKSQFILS